MQTQFSEAFLATDEGSRSNEIVRSCVHCGFCNATCPTYQVLGDELDGPRGRIYLIKEMFESQQADTLTRTHLDRCLTCRACETTCPSGVDYGDLLELGRDFIETKTRRPFLQRVKRRWVLSTLPYPKRFRRWALLGRLLRWFFPARLRRMVPKTVSPRVRIKKSSTDAQRRASPKVLLLRGCVERVVTPEAQRQLEQLLAANGIGMLWAGEEGCCGALAQHLGERQQARASMRRNIDAIWHAIEPVLDEVEAIISTASGCGVTVKEYGRLLADDPSYAAKAQCIAALTRDVSEYLTDKEIAMEKSAATRDLVRVAWQSPCTLQHGQKITGRVEQLLKNAGYKLLPVDAAGRCCGSAGTYSLFQPLLSELLKKDKLAALLNPLCAERPQVIASANVGCISHLRTESPLAVMHWLELLGPATAET